FNPSSGAVGGKRTCRISGRGNSEFLQTVVLGHCDRQSEPARLERSRRVGALLFNPDIWIALALEHRRKTFAESNRRDIGEHLAIAPHIRLAGRKILRLYFAP